MPPPAIRRPLHPRGPLVCAGLCCLVALCAAAQAARDNLGSRPFLPEEDSVIRDSVIRDSVIRDSVIQDSVVQDSVIEDSVLAEGLRQLLHRSGIIFSGHILGLVQQSTCTQVTFQVETAVRGAAPGPFVARFIDDAPGAIPMHPGERFVLFLHTPNAAGITSIVAGGVFERTGGDRVDLRRLRLYSPRQLVPHQASLLVASPIVSTSQLLRLLQKMSDEATFKPLPLYPLPTASPEQYRGP